MSFIFVDNTTETTTGEAVDMSEDLGLPKGTIIAIQLGEQMQGIWDGWYIDAETQEVRDSTKSMILNGKDLVTENPISMISVTIQGPVDIQ